MPRAGLSPERVVAEAAAVADAGGYDQLTLAAVAERFGVALPSLYKHVRGLDGLKRELAVLGVRELADVLAAAAMGRSQREALVHVADAYRHFARTRPGLYAATVRAPAADDEEHSAMVQRALDVTFAVMRSYGLEGADAVHAIRALRAAMHGFVTLEAGGGFGLPEDVDESYRRMIDAFDSALVAWSGR
jgi:AcrR family transcriptional regulator